MAWSQACRPGREWKESPRGYGLQPIRWRQGRGTPWNYYVSFLISPVVMHSDRCRFWSGEVMSEGLGNDVDSADKSIVRDSALAPVPRKDRAFERRLRFDQLWRLLRFSSAAHVDTVNVNLLIRLFRARR